MARRHLLIVAALSSTLAIGSAGVMIASRGTPPVSVDANTTDCTDRATDNDVEYAGDNDVWCTIGATPTPTSSPTLMPTSAPTTAPTTVPPPSPTAAPTQPPTATPSSAPPPALTGAFPVTYFAPDFTGPATRQFAQQFIRQIGTYVEVTYPAGSSSPSSGVPGGAQASLLIAKGKATDATLSYQVRFPVGFQWVKGGKLPGLCGGACWTGSNNGPGGWTTRYMWRSGGAGEVLLSDATTTGYGSDLGLGSWYFQADGQWHTISQHIHLNTPGQADGYIDVAYNGALVAHLTGITFRTDLTTQIDSLMFSTFYGGHDSTWAPSATEHIDFAAFHLS